MYTYTGTMKSIKQTQEVSSKFKKREFVVSDNAQSYPQIIQFELTQDRCDLLDNVAEGEEVTIQFQLRGREWKNPNGEVKVFNTLQAYSIVKTKQETKSSIDLGQLPTQQMTPDDDLPF